jgi:hypothetical protein
MTTTTPDPRRDAVRQLAGQGRSNRAIARHVGISEATVRRWRSDDAPTLTIPLDDDLAADLATLTTNGNQPSDAVRAAVRHMADAYRRAWEHGDVPADTDPVIRSCTYAGELRPRSGVRPTA